MEQRKHGGDHTSAESKFDIVKLAPTGNARQHALRKLRKDRPDLHAQVLAKKLSPHEGKIIDGRNRFNACKAIGINPTYRKWDGKGPLVSFVVSLNLHRRHMNESQRAMVAETLTNLKHGQRADAAWAASVTQPEAAEMLGVSRDSVQRARKVRESGDKKLIAAVESGDTTVSAATQHVAAVQHDASIDASERWPCFKVVNVAATIARRSSAGDGWCSVMI